METIKSLKPIKSSGYDLITTKVLTELPDEGFNFLAQLFNAVLRLAYIPTQWKVAQIKMIVKAGKSPEDIKSYLVNSLNKAIDANEFCTAIFLDIPQAF